MPRMMFGWLLWEAASRGDPGGLGACDQLPETLPPGLRSTIVHRGTTPGQLAQVLVSRGNLCPPLQDHRAQDCAVLDPVAEAALWTTLQGFHLPQIRGTPQPLEPHRPITWLTLSWDGGACILSDGADSVINAADHAAFYGAIGALQEAFAGGAPAMGPCVSEHPPPARLTDTSLAAPGTRWRVGVTFDASSGWMPRPQLRMPMHHATRVVWENVGPYAAVLAASQSGPLEFTVTLGPRTIEPEIRDGAQEWFVTLPARIESVCSPDENEDPPSSR